MAPPPPSDDAAEAADAVKTEDKKDAIKPVDEGHLGHKDQGASFPKNLIQSKEFFFFGSDAVDPKSLAHYQKSEKSAETAHDNVAWASHTGKGLLFIGDKKAPTSVINLAHASEPEVDGSNKFHFTAKGNKHSFKATSTPERDSWVAQLKLKIAEAKELVTTVAESETYRKTLESLRPAAIVAKEEKPVEDAPQAEEPVKVDDAPKEGEAAKDEVKDEESKRRSVSRKRASFFNFGGKKDEKKDERKSEDALATEPATAEAEEAPAVDAPAVAADDRPVDEALSAESPKEKPAPSKRNSFFGNVFSKKEKKLVETNKVTGETSETAADNDVTTTDAVAPVIPPVESTTPLAVDVSSPATVPTETVETPAVNSEVKKDVKEKRKSSLPFAFGKREKSPVPADNEDKSGMSAFSKLRATIKGKSASKTEEKSVEEATKDEAAVAEPVKETTTDAPTKETKSAPGASTTAQSEAENKPENVATTTPAVTAGA
ncbi:Pleckstrin domain-like protein [Ophiocordyceps sinensis CO18]|uniref:Pleckstrin domain-like protein n=1 Tax=Ophiocordyceps sinensis (strain Co18 / CGMCC 3.14243) TaxID=911162 RepID=T5AKU5_OPHSC|nr:Pleckstrin domain-like protein [Ophiocordyceps sinensis CO18]